MAFYFALFNVSSVNLEENAKKAKYKELKKSSNRCRSADGRLKSKIHHQVLADTNRLMPVRKISKNEEFSGSLESLPPGCKSFDYQSQLTKPLVVEVYNGRKISAPSTINHLPLSRLTSTDSVGTATSLANGDVKKVDVVYGNPAQYDLTRRDSTASYKRVTFRYSGDGGNTVTHRDQQPTHCLGISGFVELPPETSIIEPLSKKGVVSPSKRPDQVAQHSAFSSRFLGRLSSHTSPKIKRHATWHITNNANNNNNRRSIVSPAKKLPSTSPLNKLRAIIKKLMAENRRKKIINNIKQAAVLYHQQEQTEKNPRQNPTTTPIKMTTKKDQQKTKNQTPIHQYAQLAENNDTASISSPIDHIALVTLQNLQNQTMEEENLRDAHRWTTADAIAASAEATCAAPVHRHHLFGQSWCRHEDAPVSRQTTNDARQLPPTTWNLRRTPSMMTCSNRNNKTNHNNKNAETKLKRRSAAIMETRLGNTNDNLNNGNSSSSSHNNNQNRNKNNTLPNQCRCQDKNNNNNRHQHQQTKPTNPQRLQSKEKHQQQKHENQNNKKPMVRRKSTTDRIANQTNVKTFGTWNATKWKKRSSSSTSQQSNDADEETHKLLPLFDENCNSYYSADAQRYDIICDRQFYGWLPINGYVNPLFVSLSAPNSPVHVRMREKRNGKQQTNVCSPNYRQADQRISLIETNNVVCSKRNAGAMFPKPKTSWWNRPT